MVSTGFAAGASTTAFTGVSALTSAAVVLTSAFTVSVFGAAFAAALAALLLVAIVLILLIRFQIWIAPHRPL